MRSIRKSDIPDLQLRRDYAGWMEAKNDMERRFEKDPWFGVNARLQEAIQLGEPDETIRTLQALAERLGGPPPGLTVGPRGYAQHTEIYGTFV
jgi:hypothetical protein